jgi:hypothetical protein
MWWLVGFRGETSKPFAVEVDSQRIAPCKQHVNSQVELQSIDQEWPVDVPLYNVMVIWGEVFKGPCKEDTFALAARFWFRDESLRLAFLKLSLKVAPVSRQYPCLREEIVFGRELFLHFHQIFS